MANSLLLIQPVRVSTILLASMLLLWIGINVIAGVVGPCNMPEQMQTWVLSNRHDYSVSTGGTETERISQTHDKDGTLAKILKVISAHSGLASHRIARTARLDADLGICNIHKIEIIMGLEEEFSCEISDDEVRRIVTVQDLDDCIQKICLSP